jgi:hypothetical protein
MIQVRYLKCFDESVFVFSTPDRKRATRTLSKLLDYFSGGPRPLGLGLRKLRKDYWEVRVGLAVRIIFLLEKDLATFVLAGSHDDIRKYLKQ